MKRFAKKAFTLVELLVVIAIIAILAVAGVVGYMAFTKKAEVNNDTSLVAELNNYVAAASATDKINTPTDIRDILVDDGIDLATLKLSAAKQGYIPGFDIVAKKFVLIKDNALADGYTAAKTSDVFAFAKTEAEANALKDAGFSLYLQSGYDAASIGIAGKGLDVGENTGITTINYTGDSSAHDVVIRTNSANTNLTINAEHDTVNHYGSVGKVDAQKVDMNCYNEYGKAAYVKLLQGKVVAKAGGTISVVFATNTDASKVQIINDKGTIETGYTSSQAIDTANQAAGGIALTYSINDQPVTEEVVNTYAEAAVENNVIEEVEASGLYEARIGTVGYETLETAIEAVQKGQTIVIIKDIEKGSEYRTPGWNKGFNMDFKGHSFTTVYEGNPMWTTGCITFTDLQNGTSDDYSATISNAVLYSKNGNGLYIGAGQSICGVTLTVENCTVIQNGNNAGEKEHHAALRITERGKMIVNSGTYTGAKYSLVVSNSGGEYTINGGTFNGSLYFSANTDSGVTKSYTINGGTFNSFAIVNPDKGTVTINGGTFDADPSAYVSSGHHAVNNGDGTWTVVAD